MGAPGRDSIPNPETCLPFFATYCVGATARGFTVCQEARGPARIGPVEGIVPTTPVWELPDAPPELHGDGLVLRFDRLRPGDEERGFLPAYLYLIFLEGGAEVGQINFRVGTSRHARLVAGHIGFEVAPDFRGGRIALRACRLLAPLVAEVSGEVIITCDPDNLASKRTIELLGAEFLDEQEIPEDDPAYDRGSRWKLRYAWRPGILPGGPPATREP